MKERIGVNSLKYLDMNSLRECLKEPDEYCYACFDGKYPLEKE
jgi:amidophosphoribosyltransferase